MINYNLIDDCVKCGSKVIYFAETLRKVKREIESDRGRVRGITPVCRNCFKLNQSSKIVADCYASEL